MKKKWMVFLLAAIISAAGPACADFYVWEDESGVSHITDYPPPSNLNKSNMKIYEESRKAMEERSAQKAKNPVITLFTKNNCPDCDKAKNFFNSKNLDFQEFNMDEDENAVIKRKEIDDDNDVPLAVINRTQIHGFSEKVYNRALKPAP